MQLEGQRVLNEFELTYRVTFLPRPSLTAQTTEPARPSRPALETVGTLGTRPQLVDPTAPTPTPCRQI
jgi:hypothetical protein